MQGEKKGTHSNFAEVSESEKVRVIPHKHSFFSSSVLDKKPVDLKVLAIHQFRNRAFYSGKQLRKKTLLPPKKRSSTKAEEANGKPRKKIHLCSMSEVIWSSWTPENAHAHSQWSEDPHLLRM